MSFTRLVCIVWLVPLLDLLLRVQLNILGRHLFLESHLLDRCVRCLWPNSWVLGCVAPWMCIHARKKGERDGREGERARQRARQRAREKSKEWIFLCTYVFALGCTRVPFGVHTCASTVVPTNDVLVPGVECACACTAHVECTAMRPPPERYTLPTCIPSASCLPPRSDAASPGLPTPPGPLLVPGHRLRRGCRQPMAPGA